MCVVQSHESGAYALSALPPLPFSLRLADHRGLFRLSLLLNWSAFRCHFSLVRSFPKPPVSEPDFILDAVSGVLEREGAAATHDPENLAAEWVRGWLVCGFA